MNCVERARAVGDSLPKLKRLKDEKSRLDEYTARKKILVGATEALEEYAIVAKELQERGTPVTGFKKSVLGHQKEVQRLIKAFREDRKVIIAPETTESFWHPLKLMPAKVKDELEKAWKKYVESMIPSGQVEILEILGRVQGFAGQAAAVNRLRNDMGRLGNQLPKQDDFQTLDNLAEQMKQAWNELNGEGLPPAVLNFLKKAHRNGISLADLDNDVLDWLRGQDLLGRYVIRGQ